MRLAPLLFGAVLGRRLPVTTGSVAVEGLSRPLTIRRDRWSIPHIDAQTDADAWFGLGFCQAQDRAFQLEMLLRLVRGTLAALVGPEGLAADRLARRIGFHRAGQRLLAALDLETAEAISSFARGVNAGIARGLPRRPHELVLLRAHPTPWTAVEPLGVLVFESFLLASNWDLELARLMVLSADGPHALAALDPGYREWHPVAVPLGERAGGARRGIAVELPELTERAARWVTAAGGSNSWALAGSRTATGRPILANDPHLAPILPAPWYLAHLRTPEWSLAGASFVGGPAFPVAHNGHAAWGVTAGLADTSDTFIEEIGPDGASVRDGEGFVPCEVRLERIEVKGGATVEERVLETPRGPIVGPALAADVGAVSLRATWLEGGPARGLLALHRTRSFDEFRRAFERWPAVSLNVVYADAGGTIGYQLVGDVPLRASDGGLPRRGADAGRGWDALVPFEDIPHARDPEAGYLATANTMPTPRGVGPDLGDDFIEGYRLARIVESLGARSDWDVRSAQALQMDTASIPWREMREAVLVAAAGSDELREAHALLAAWDGRVTDRSRAAGLYELFVAELAVLVARLKAPNGYRWALGRGFSAILPVTIFAVRRVGHLVQLLRERPDGWSDRPWDTLICDALAAAWATLVSAPDGSAGWGHLRPLRLRHPLGSRRPLERVFDLGPFPWGGDANTVSQAAVDPLAPRGAPLAIASLRAVMDVGAWDESRFVLSGGQSGNPCSPHYDDQLPLWRRGAGVPIAFSDAAVASATTRILRLEVA